MRSDKEKVVYKVLCLVGLALLVSAGNVLAAPTPPPQAKGVLRNTAGAAIGNVLFTQAPNGTVFVSVAVKNLPPGTHGVSIRARGSCASGFASAGAAVVTLPNIVVKANGIGELVAATTKVTVTSGRASLLDANGSAVVVTAFRNAQSKVACAVLQRVPVPAPLATSATRASAVFHSVDGREVGTATLTQLASGAVRVSVKVHGLPQGVHAIHVHQFGMCAPTFGAAGEHHNPQDTHHGMNNPMEPNPHAGDLPNLTVRANGTGTLETTTRLFTLSPSDTTIRDTDGSSLVLHALPDNYRTDPDGRVNGRIACAIVRPVMAGTAPSDGTPSQLPDTGSSAIPWAEVSLVGVLAFAAGFVLRRRVRAMQP